jgi:hypothetical protein
MDSLWQYYGVDCAAVVFTFFGMWLIGLKHLGGPTCMALAAVFWSIVGWMTQSYPMLVANIIFLVMNIWTFWKWSHRSL